MLQLRPNCECCDCDLPADSADARICSFECTYCAQCSERLGQRCPIAAANCSHVRVVHLTSWSAIPPRRSVCSRQTAATEGLTNHTSG